MTIQTPTASRCGPRFAILGRLWKIVPLVVLIPAIFAASAQAHTVTASATCQSVTFHWTAFAANGGGNGGLNTPEWAISAPATPAMSGHASFSGSSFSLTVPVPAGNRVVTASSSWTMTQTRDGNHGSRSQDLTISNCPAPPMPPAPPVPPVPPVTPATSPTAAGPALSTTAPPAVAVLASCVSSPVVLRGISAKVHKRLTAHVTSLGVKSVTFYLDARKLVTLTKPSHQRFTVTVDARRLSYGVHRLSARVTMRNADCVRAAAAGAFVKVRTPVIRPHFTG
jgi:hypothetical protein